MTEALLLIVLVIFLAALGVPAYMARHRDSPQPDFSHLRQFGIGVANYAIENDDWTPPGDLNTFHYVAMYTGESVAGPEGSDVFRCPEDNWLPDRNADLLASYAFNVSLDVDENDTYSPFSMATSGHWQRLGGAAPDTIIAIEMWMKPRPDGTFPNELRLNDPNWDRIKAGAALISSYTSTKTATFDSRGRLVDPGPYRFLDCYVGTDVPVDEMYHVGVINVLLADGHVDQWDIHRFTSRSPVEDPRWTRQRDGEGWPRSDE